MVSSLPPPVSQLVTARLTRAAIFMVVTINPGAEPQATIRGLCADLSSLLRGVGFRNLQGNCPASWGLVPKWHVPDAFAFVDELPHTATGKLQKGVLRDQYKEFYASQRS